ncbi:hypothetical protein JCGZ_26980 [Jatropha curcas]|uniref:Agglutinin domain-containing protein n=1 Tax=Jatropha curcas TaxID=180498 RepID=A0A067L0K3_JATCU|nr:hypothetical protein JCGZ_26980 [Jatropha curcas]
MALSLALPRFVALRTRYETEGQAVTKYVRFLHEDGDLHGFLRADGDEIVTPYTKFELEKAESGDDSYHIRNCYNNKYLVIKEGTMWYIGGADEPEEDASKSNCTVFFIRALVGSNNYIIRPANLPHFFLHRATVSTVFDHRMLNCLHRFNGASTSYEIIDFDSIIVLPKYITLPNPGEGLYLSSRSLSGRQFLQFGSDDYLDTTTWFETFTTNDGGARIMCKSSNRFWRKDSTWVFADSSNSTGEDTLFWPVKTEGNAIALRAWHNMYCHRHTANGMADCLALTANSISTNSLLHIEEAVRSREIYNVSFRTLDGRIYDFSKPLIVTQDVDNWSQQSTQDGELRFTYTETKSSRWDHLESWMVEASMSLSSKIPFLVQTTISIGAGYEGSYTWGETEETSKEISTNLRVEVPPMTRTRVTMIVSKGAIDVPFSYTQRDTLYDYSTALTQKHDGIFTGVTTYVKYDIAEESLIAPKQSIAEESLLAPKQSITEESLIAPKQSIAEESLVAPKTEGTVSVSA